MQNNWKVYLLECFDGTYYCGVTNQDIAQRIAIHNNGKGSKYTRGRLPVKLLAYQDNLSKNLAYQLEYQIKKLPRQQKLKSLSAFCEQFQ